MNSRAFYKHVLFLLFSLSLSISSVAANEPSSAWRAPHFKNHALVGQIWDTHKQKFIDEIQFYRELNQYDIILLGEIHNHPDHHVLQAKAIDALVDAGSKPAVVMEMLSHSSWQDQPLQWQKTSELQELASMLNDGWPWELYTPVLKSVVHHNLSLYPGNINSAALHAWVKRQPSKNRKQVYREYAYTKEEFLNLENTIVESHCGHANENLVNHMSHAQMQRDHIITSSLLNKPGPVVLIAGNGHIRNDYAVPMQLRRKFNQTSYLSVAYLPVQEELQEPHEYYQVLQNLFDVVYFTPNHTLEDPCEKFRKQLKNMQHRQTP